MKIDWTSRSGSLAVLALVGIAVARIMATYGSLNQAYDEPAHIACGMEWLDKGTFQMEPQHPPLPRVMSALGPYLAGLHLPPIQYAGGNPADGFDFYGAGNQILAAQGRYFRNLTLARVGTLPFLVLAAWITFLWARSLVGNWFAVVAVFWLTTLPVVLGYCTLAYVDPALMAMFPLAVFAFVRWLDAPKWRESLLLGAAVAGAALANAPWMVFLPPCLLAILACRWWALRGQSPQKTRAWLQRWIPAGGLALLGAWIVLWGGYRFSVAPLDRVFEHPVRAVEQLHLPGPVRVLAMKVVAANPRVPAPEFFKGLGNSIGEKGKLYPAYLFGEVKRGGWWYFYFFMLAFKTPPGFLLLAVLGAGLTLGRFRNSRDWCMAAPAVCVGVILFLGMLIRVNLGVRTILFVYPLMSILAAMACREIWEFGRAGFQRSYLAQTNSAMKTDATPQGFVARLRLNARCRLARQGALVALGVLFLAHVVIGIWIHPGYLTYTSFLAGRHPEYSLVLDADFDAGQNVLPLAWELRKLNVTHVSLRLYTSADLTMMGLPPYKLLVPYEKASGWIAVSLHHLRTGEGPRYPALKDGYEWLNAYQPLSDVGGTIRVYYVPQEEQAR